MTTGFLPQPEIIESESSHMMNASTIFLLLLLLIRCDAVLGYHTATIMRHI